MLSLKHWATRTPGEMVFVAKFLGTKCRVSTACLRMWISFHVMCVRKMETTMNALIRMVAKVLALTRNANILSALIELELALRLSALINCRSSRSCFVRHNWKVSCRLGEIYITQLSDAEYTCDVHYRKACLHRIRHRPVLRILTNSLCGVAVWSNTNRTWRWVAVRAKMREFKKRRPRSMTSLA